MILKSNHHHHLILRHLGIDTSQEHVIFMRRDCHVCRAEGFSAAARVRVFLREKSIIATLQIVDSEILGTGEVSLSNSAWQALAAKERDSISVSHPEPVESLRFVRTKIYGKPLDSGAYRSIISDIVEGLYSDVQISAFVTACSDDHLSLEEIVSLTKAMIDAGEKLKWDHAPIVDKHCVGGLPGNRTTILIVPIVAAFGLTIPKSSSRAITSPAGTADTMEVLAPVNLSTRKMKEVVEREGGCIVWGGSIGLSPADDILIRVERALDIDSEGQLIASVLSKKAAAGSTHVVIDMPVGSTAKIRTLEVAARLGRLLKSAGQAIGLQLETIVSDGSQPVGRGIGPVLEAQEVLQILRNQDGHCVELRERALLLSAKILELVQAVPEGTGVDKAREILQSGQAWKKFQAICEAQGGMREPLPAKYRQDVTAKTDGTIRQIDNRRLAKVAKLAGAPHAKSAGLFIHTPQGSRVERGSRLFTVHAESPGELDYALSFVKGHDDIFLIGEAS